MRLIVTIGLLLLIPATYAICLRVGFLIVGESYADCPPEDRIDLAAIGFFVLSLGGVLVFAAYWVAGAIT